ncbi:MAG: hypothetical protein NXI27_23505 [Alphaproteobacteria bacterium]|nr:hypothetical protein [Alphaproteobacteria bacterium]
MTLFETSDPEFVCSFVGRQFIDAKRAWPDDAVPNDVGIKLAVKHPAARMSHNAISLERARS